MNKTCPECGGRIIKDWDRLDMCEICGLYFDEKGKPISDKQPKANP